MLTQCRPGQQAQPEILVQHIFGGYDRVSPPLFPTTKSVSRLKGMMADGSGGVSGRSKVGLSLI
jgi:hypothetical protein